jgi:hypothetical protein
MPCYVRPIAFPDFITQVTFCFRAFNVVWNSFVSKLRDVPCLDTSNLIIIIISCTTRWGSRLPPGVFFLSSLSKALDHHILIPISLFTSSSHLALGLSAFLPGFEFSSHFVIWPSPMHCMNMISPAVSSYFMTVVNFSPLNRVYRSRRYTCFSRLRCPVLSHKLILAPSFQTHSFCSSDWETVQHSDRYVMIGLEIKRHLRRFLYLLIC